MLDRALKLMMRCLAIFFILISAAAGLAPTANGTPRVVRVGYYQAHDALQSGENDDERKSGYAYDYYQAIAYKTGWTYEYVYGSRQEMLNKLVAGEIDIMAAVHRTDKLAGKIAYSAMSDDLPHDQTYFAVAYKSRNLLPELDRAMAEIKEEDPFFTLRLYEQYYTSSTKIKLISDSDRAALRDSGGLTMGYIKGMMPIGDIDDNGEPTGIAGEIRDMLTRYLHTPVRTVAFDTYDDLFKALADKKINIAFPVAKDNWMGEQYGIMFCRPLLDDRLSIVYKGDYDRSKRHKIAMSAKSTAINYVRNLYPDAEIVFHESYEDCLKAVINGSVDCAICVSYVLNRLVAGDETYVPLSTSSLGREIKYTLAVSRDNRELLPILDSALIYANDYSIHQALVMYSNVGKNVTLASFVKANLTMTALIVSFLVLTLLLAGYTYTTKLKTLNVELEKQHKLIQRAMEEAQQANNAKTVFLNSMSHDIRTPMNAIIGFTTLASTHLDEREKVADYLRKIHASSNHLLSLINDVLDMSRIESGKVVIDEKPVLLPELLHNLKSIIQGDIKAKQLKLHFDTVDVRDEMVWCDRLRLNQVLLNCISNAIKYTPEGGFVSVKTTQVESRREGYAGFVFKVADNGIGMSPEFLKTIFEQFTREQTSTVSGIQGTGLGMSITKNIVDMLGGTITAASEKGQGSEFTIKLEMKLVVGDKPEPIIRKLYGVRALLVHQDSEVCASVAEMLKTIGLVPEWLTDAEEAVRKAQIAQHSAAPYGLYMIDRDMPDIDGIEIVRRIKTALGDTSSVIVLTAYEWMEIEAQAKEAGVTAFCAKPLYFSGIHNTLKKAVDSDAAAKESQDEELSNLAGVSILLVEDNELNREIAETILEEAGAKVDTAEDGVVAVEKVRDSVEGQYDVVLMDVQMPKMDGYEATKAIRGLLDDYHSNMPIIAMTANAFEEDKQAALAAGMNAHVAKPIDIDVLLETIRKIINK